MTSMGDGSERKRILLSDDEPDLVYATTLYLQAEGYEVRSWPEPLKTVELAGSWQPDLIVTDVYKAPHMDWIEMTRRLKADERTRDIPVIVLSASCGNPEGRQRALDAGACVAIAKPFDPKDLLKTIRNVLGQAQ
jgi:CheY-like chemotaxis protein